MAEYGIPYMGSKGSICNRLVSIFPKAMHFYDLFGGGFSVTHAMMLRRKRDFKHFHFNEIRPDVCDLIKKAINGDFNYNKFKPPWVSREDFFKNIDSNAMIKMLWSFGNNGENYLFSKEVEPYKRSMHNAIIFNEFDELAEKVLGLKKFNDGYSVLQKRLFLGNKIETYRKTKVPEFLWIYLNEGALAIVKRNEKAEQLRSLPRLEPLERLQRLQQLEPLERLQRLQQLERLERLQQLEPLQQLEQLQLYTTSYENIPILDNSVIYCDIPYKGTAGYDCDFDHAKFFDWADAQIAPVFISEYNVEDKRFRLVKKIEKRSLLSSDKTMNVKLEKIYVNRAAHSSGNARRL